MKMFGKIAAFVSAFGLLLAFFGCSNASGGALAATAPTAPTMDNPGAANSSKILDLRIKKNGVAYGSGASASVSPNVSKSLADGLSFAAASSEQLPGDGYDEKLWTTDRYQTSHVKVENVPGGIKFIITRPADDYYNPKFLIREENERYKYVGAGKGDYAFDRYENVGAGKGDHIKVCDNYSLRKPGEGEYEVAGFEYVGEGKGTFEKTVSSGRFDYEYVGAGNGNYEYDYPHNHPVPNKDGYYSWYKDVGEGNGSYKFNSDCSFEWIGWDNDNNKGKGSYLRKMVKVGKNDVSGWVEDHIYKWVGDNNGDYVRLFKSVGTGNGDYITNKIYGGEGWTCIERHEMISGNKERTMRAAVIIDNNVDVWTCLYPLCEPGERYVFQIELQTTDGDNLREAIKQEWLSIVAENGVGDIDYSNLNEARHLELTYDGEKPTSTVSNFIPPENVKNLYSRIEYFAGTTEWAPGTTYWFAGYNQDASNPVFDKDPCMEDVKSWAKPEEVELYRASRCFNATLKSKGKKQFFSEQFFSFQVPEAQGISEFRTINLRSDYAYME